MNKQHYNYWNSKIHKNKNHVINLDITTQNYYMLYMINLVYQQWMQ